MKNKKRKDITCEILKELYLDKLMSSDKIAKKFNCSSVLIQNYIKKYGIKIRSLKESAKLKWNNVEYREQMKEVYKNQRICICPEKLLDLYINKKMTSNQISIIFGCSVNTILRNLKKNGIKVRTQSEIMKNSWSNTKFRKHMEEVYNNNKVFLNKEEVREFYKSGMTVQQIGDKLGAARTRVCKLVKDILRPTGFKKGHKIFIKIISEEFKEKCRQNALKQFKDGMPEKTRKKLRNAQIKNVERQKFNGLPLTPCVGRHETRILDVLETSFGYPILRQYRVNGYFLDGYCQMLNLVVEIDEPYHKSKEQLKKDNLRQANIEKELGCKFLRIEVPK